MTNAPAPPPSLHGHGGTHAVAAARAHGQSVLWTLSGAHIFPMLDAAVNAPESPLRIIDVRHEATAVFAAEATGKLSRSPGFASVTAGPGVTNSVSAIASAWFNGSPCVVLGGRAPAGRWGTGALQELDHPPLVSSITKEAFTITDPASAAPELDRAFGLAASPHRGPVFVDVPMDVLFSFAEAPHPAGPALNRLLPDPDSIQRIAEALQQANRPVLVIGGDVWADGAEGAALALVDQLRIPTIANGMGRGILPRGHDCLVTRARSTAFGQADLVLVVGAPLDFRLGYGIFGGKDGADPADVIHIADSPGEVARHTTLRDSTCGDLSAVLTGLADVYGKRGQVRDHSEWLNTLTGVARKARADDDDLLGRAADPIHPARIYGELIPRLADDAIVIGDGGDFVSFAGRFIEPQRPGHWLDPGPFGCLGTGLGYAMAARAHRPSGQVVLLLGDGAAGFSLMDVDTLVRHQMPVVMVVGNNSAWALEKHPMRFLYGYDVAADLRPTEYDAVVSALGGAGETVRAPEGIGPALDRAFASGVPYLVNVMTDTDVAYPRSTTGV
ncbi:MAG: acetolactate synthase [Candidatus Nanopelagicales bacterium]|nr:acetolactate synthase [Candidatus Nanopelagicales bacterium]MDZ4249499.1 acetolactate synthase [Candidatus Nanopelagicales bacterium]